MSRAYTAEDDPVILEGRAAGRSWQEIGKQIRTTGKACQYRLTRGLQVPDPKAIQVGRKNPRRPPQDESKKRDALAPGADTSWQAITAGTVLEGSAYR
ncbi:MAG: hypothetical protein ACRYHQ_03350 [Janthinobacterium lividum]